MLTPLPVNSPILQKRPMSWHCIWATKNLCADRVGSPISSNETASATRRCAEKAAAKWTNATDWQKHVLGPSLRQFYVQNFNEDTLACKMLPTKLPRGELSREGSSERTKLPSWMLRACPEAAAFCCLCLAKRRSFLTLRECTERWSHLQTWWKGPNNGSNIRGTHAILYWEFAAGGQKVIFIRNNRPVHNYIRNLKAINPCLPYKYSDWISAYGTWGEAGDEEYLAPSPVEANSTLQWHGRQRSIDLLWAIFVTVHAWKKLKCPEGLLLTQKVLKTTVKRPGFLPRWWLDVCLDHWIQ